MWKARKCLCKLEKACRVATLLDVTGVTSPCPVLFNNAAMASGRVSSVLLILAVTVNTFASARVPPMHATTCHHAGHSHPTNLSSSQLASHQMGGCCHAKDLRFCQPGPSCCAVRQRQPWMKLLQVRPDAGRKAFSPLRIHPLTASMSFEHCAATGEYRKPVSECKTDLRI